MGNIDQSDLQFPDAGNDGNHDAQQDELTSFDSSTLLFPSVGDADEPQHTAPAQPPQPPAKARRSAKAAKPTAKSAQPAQPAQPERTTDGDGFDLPVWGAGDATSNADEPTQLFTPAEAAQRATTAMPAIDSTTVERTQLIAQDRPARTVVNDVNETHTALPEPKGPASFAPMGGDGDGGSTDHEAPDNGGNGKRKKIIIGVVSAVVVVALAAGGVVLWQRNRSAQENRSHDAAVESCERAHTALQTAYTELDKQISKTKPLAQTKDSAVADAATLQAFQKSSKVADELQQKKDEAVVACNTADSREKLEQNAQSMDEQIDGVESATKQLKSDADALTASRDAKSTKSLKDDLTKAIADAQTTYDESANAVADEQTRTALQQAIGEAQIIADKPSLDKAAVDTAKEKLTNAVNAVVESENALAEANAAAAQEALRQQQLQQEQAQQQALQEQQALQQQQQALQQQQQAQQQQPVQQQPQQPEGNDANANAGNTGAGATPDTTTGTGTGTGAGTQ